MAVISIINQKELEGSKRIDAEFYQPIFIRERKRLQSIKNIIILQKVAYITDGQHGYHIVDEKSNIRHITAKNVKEGIVLDHEADRLSILTHKKNQRSALEENDVLLTTVGTIGIAGIVTSRILPANIDQDVARIHVFNKTVLNPFYLTAFLLSEYGQLQIRFNTTGQDRQHLALEKIKQLKIPYFKIQDIIGNEIYKAINRFILSEEFYTQAEQLLLSELGLHDWKPRHTLTYVGSFSQVGRAGRMDAEHFHPKYKELREIIRNYPRGYLKLLDIAFNSNETIEPCANPEHDFEYIELADLNQTIGVIENAKIIKGKDAPSRARMLLRSGDVIASSVEGSLDKVALVSEEYDGAIGSTGFFVLRPRTVSSGYLLALIKSIIVREQMRCEASGTILSAVPAKSLKNIIVPNIPPEKQDEISALVQQSHAARREAKNLIEKAKRAVEIAIEEGEERAMEYLSM